MKFKGFLIQKDFKKHIRLSMILEEWTRKLVFPKYK